MKRMSLHAIALSLACAIASFGFTAAQDQPAAAPAVTAAAPEQSKPPEPPKPTDPAKPAEPSKTEDPAKPVEAGNEKALREQTIYIPYSKLRETFEKEGRGVFLPYDQFQQLWKQAREARATPAEKAAPYRALISEITSEASIERDVMVVAAKLKIEVLGKGWHEIPLRLTDSAIRSASVDGQPARITYDQQSGYKLLIHSDNAEPKWHELSLEYARAFTKSPGLNSVQFTAPQAPINRWQIRIPQSGVKVNVQPMIAATEVPVERPPAPPMPEEQGTGETVLMAFVGAAPEVRIDWTPKTEGATGLEALATAQVQQEVVLEEGVVRTRVRLAYEISRAELPQLSVEIPTDQKVTGVFDANVRQWEVATQGDKQTITIHLFEAAKKTQNVTIEMERFSDQLVMTAVKVPVVKAVGVGRQQGVVVVRISEELRAEPTVRSGLLQQDAAELPAPLQGQPWTFAYRYSSLPFELVLRAEKVKPRIRVEELAEVFLEPDQTTISFLSVFDIQLAGVFQLEFDVPAGYDIRSVRGQAVAGVEAAAVDSHSVEGENKTRLKINLARKAIGKVGVLVEFYKRTDDPNLLVPTGQASQLAWVLPRTAMTTEEVKGRVILYAPESLRITPQKQGGVRPVGFTEALQGVESQRQGRFPTLREVVAFLYTSEPIDLTTAAERRKPQVDARQLLTAHIESGVVKYEAKFHFDVKYSSVKSLRIDVPTSLAKDIHVTPTGIREQAIDPRPADAAEGYTPWSLTGEREFLGDVEIQLNWEEKSKELEVGKSIDYVIPRIRPVGVDRAWGQIVIAKAETLDVAAKAGFTGLRPIDPQQDLMDKTRIADAARAFEFHDDWSLTITATRYELEDVKRTSVERAVLRVVVTRSKSTSVQALYRVRSAVQRLLVKLPVGAQFDTDPLRLNGRSVPLEHGDKDELFIPLVGQNPEQPFVLELRYTVVGDHTQIDFPVFPAQPPIQSEPAVQKVYMLVYLPEEMTLLGSRGPWTSEQAGWADWLNGSSREQDDRSLVNWVTEGTELQNKPYESFATGGKLYTFTTLRPAAPPVGSLRLVAWHERWLNVVILGGLIILGIVWMRRPAREKLIVLTVLITILVVAGVFAPTFTLQILSPAFFVAFGLVLLLWILGQILLIRRSNMVHAQPAPVSPVATETPFSPRDSELGSEPVDINRTVDADDPDSATDADSPPDDSRENRGERDGGVSHE